MSSENKIITLFGMGGFIGSAAHEMLLEEQFTVERGDWEIKDFNQKNLGIVIITCGVGDCQRVEDVIYSHVDIVRNIINTARYEKIIYLSSTRVYLHNDHSRTDASLTLDPQDSRVLFNQVKLLAETIIKAQSKPFLILRPSNVYGKAFNSKLFLPSLVRDAIKNKVINMYVSPDYSKDYVYCGDVCRTIVAGVKFDITGVYNVASGENFPAGEIASILEDKTGTEVIWHKNNVADYFPIIDTKDSNNVFGFKPVRVNEMLAEMVNDFTNEFNN
ncbi:NAD-dependent epimerase/dehydratase family protein [Pantoea sp. FN060301]|uniref:NAD-dependent epimerase/dehydratase family protein n=1 Tax=Pantoea sp. FN060301 TaxID=3420380 RepID=UPI003D16305E